jgi:hypothetical protein
LNSRTESIGEGEAASASPEREVRQRVVAPVVAQAALHEVPLVGVVVHGHQLHRRHAERRQVPDRRFRRESQVRAAQRIRHERVQPREALHMQLVDERLVPRRPRRAIVAHVKAASTTADSGVRGAVAFVERRVVAPMRKPNSESFQRTAR